ncbi:Aldehyde oxidase/xanthine dehydrogenase, a/b hammerhead, partial [Corchorus capsularis]
MVNHMETTTAAKPSLVFAVNGQRFDVSQVDPCTTLLEFLRSQTPFKSVKLSCGEGGCGACSVLLSKYDPVLDQVEDFTVNSCLTLLCSINRCSITTAEGVGNSKDGFHPIQERFPGFHASQCGFCTPGMCVSLFSALVNADKKTNRPEPRPGFSKLTVSEAEKAIAGNLCRCTGYRPIADACKSFAADVDMEDLGFNSFWRKGETDEVKLSRLPPNKSTNAACAFPEFLKKETLACANLASEGCHWYSPVSIEQLQSLLQMDDNNGGTSMKIVVGNTGMGYYKELEHYDKYIDLRNIPELSIIRKDLTGIEIGAAVTISKAIEALKEGNEGKINLLFNKIADHMEKIASQSIRNSASLGGNLVMAQRRHFPSDIATILLCVDTLVEVMTGQRHEKLRLEEFLGRPPLDTKSILLSIKIPSWESSRNVPSGTTDTFLAQVSHCKNPAGRMLRDCRLAFGAYGIKHSIRVREVEEFLYGKVLSIGVLYEAIKLLESLIKPEDGTSSPAYRSSLALIQFDNEYKPVGEPVTKIGAVLQASGEAIYVDDIPSPKNCLHGAFIYSTEPLARVKGIKLNPGSSSSDGVVALISSKDIPGLNLGSKTIFGTEPLYADDLTKGVGQRIAFVVADTQKQADTAANLAVIDYDKDNLEPPILSIEEAVERSSFYTVPPFLYPEQVGDFSKGMAEADHKILSAEA